ncbi:DUF4974 domain-containing protein [Pedobacter hiemivivus]|uniref:DUF4974 domain-containing protein n=1 Tax=Pedobacter hiemivivus TaxID=2530454 RepID=A0A4U1GEB1_9SPHI|nr:FecR family protein [Pedobacter hiemivivus]TCC94682.1 FecR family protein [Pedobacter hiemivivus]TKC62415.1 DUF4974 domain-containing protein [Pedobacter hiemivivus]
MDSKEQELLKKYLEGKSTETENALLESWYLKYKDPGAMEASEEEIKIRYTKIAKALPVTKKPLQSNLMLWKGLAAACLVAFTLGVYFYFGNKQVDIAPGGNRAILQIANGKKIDLNSQKDGIINDGTGLSYEDGSPVDGVDNNGAEIQELNLSTPNGGQYQLTLSDGTKVWLNAASSITYPSRFGNKNRVVKVIGEAYFEVAHISSRPFVVESKGQTLFVLGTGFNIAAYPNDRLIKTTLVHGKVKITNNLGDKKGTILSPGQQLQVSANEIKLINDADIEEITAWRDGYFKFSESLESIMSKISRWYDVDIIYQGNFDGNLKFLGKVSRTKNLSAILEIIESASNVHFKVEGRSVIVMN